jgi:hypothetical protein
MTFTGLHLAIRYVDDDLAEGKLKVALRDQAYAIPGRERQPAEQAMSFYDFVFAAGMGPPYDEGAISRGVDTLTQFPQPPYWEQGRDNCDPAEVAALRCTLDDGTEVQLLDEQGRGGDLVSQQPVPMRVRPASNYHWRSNPYRVNNAADGSRLLSAADFRLAYWMARWIRRADSG